MVKAESEFKTEVKRSLEAYLHGFGAPVWCPSDKFTNGLSDVQFVAPAFFGAWELKNVVDLPKRDATNILKQPFTALQIKFLMSVNRQDIGRGLGIVRLPEAEALVIYPSELVNHLQDGNLSKEKAEQLYNMKTNLSGKPIVRVIHRHKGGVWNIEPLFKADKYGGV